MENKIYFLMFIFLHCFATVNLLASNKKGVDSGRMTISNVKTGGNINIYQGPEDSCVTIDKIRIVKNDNELSISNLPEGIIVTINGQRYPNGPDSIPTSIIPDNRDTEIIPKSGISNSKLYTYCFICLIGGFALGYGMHRLQPKKVIVK